MLSVKEAQEKVLSSANRRILKKVPILSSLSLILAQDVVSNDDIPMYDNSAVDGYAVRAEDVKGADRGYPVRLKLFKKDIPAGSVSDFRIELGHCVSIMTGAPIPSGCDCVVMKEDTEVENGEVLVYREVSAGENIRYRGEDIKKGDIVLPKGKKIYPADIGVMASIGVSEVLVYYPPTVGIITTGSELIEVSEKLEVGKVRDSNSYSLASQIKEINVPYVRFGIVMDEKKVIKNKILEALAMCDILLLTGGVSVGEYDYVKEILDEIGANLIFWRVNQKPGKPLAFWTFKNKSTSKRKLESLKSESKLEGSDSKLETDEKFIFGLPGNPVSVMVCFEMYVRPLVSKIMGYERLFRNSVVAQALHDFKHKEGRTEFVRVAVEKRDKQYFFKSTGMQGSGILTSMSRANGIAVFPENVGDVREGCEAEVYLIRDEI
ncbi:MAG: molybdopterin molybdotransferase MoeA [Actinobacteria bacterium]|nr:molybdopterin molybdotransferase MoeA [Actinomycetota bacterium]